VRRRRRRHGAVGLALAGLLPGLIAGPSGAQGRPLPSALWGVTLDDTADIGPGPLQHEVTGLEALPTMPISRIVMDVGAKPGVYADAVTALQPSSYLMAELGDSSEMKRQTVPGYERFESALVRTYSADIDLWEIGNEVNGE
jgi:hypothetical protein